MPSQIARIDVYPDYDEDGRVSYLKPFSYGCLELDLMGYQDIRELVKKIRTKLYERNKDALVENDGGTNDN